MLFEIIWLFLKLGATSFGGPIAHISLMEEEFVHRRKWLSRDKFLELIALTNIIPGPNSTELAIHIGYLRAGWWGLWLAGISFILPAFLIVTAIAYFYSEYSMLPQVQHFLFGIKAVVLAVIIQAVYRFLIGFLKLKSLSGMLASSFWKIKHNTILIFIIALSFYLRWRGFAETAVLFNSAVICFFLSRKRLLAGHNELGSLFLIFLKMGSLLFGSGYVLLSFLQSELIEKHHLLSQAQLLDAISVGQFTPGPVFTTASFVGYLIHGFSGSIVATIGIFLPAFFFVALSIPLYKKFHSSVTFQVLLEGVVAGSLGLLLYTLWTLILELSSPMSWILCLASLVLLWRQIMPTAVLILIGGLISFSLA